VSPVEWARDAAAAQPVPVALLVTVAVAVGVAALAAALRRMGRMGARLLAGRRPEDVLTVAAAGIATGVAAQGMWRFFGDVLGFSGPLRVLLFAFIELAVVTSAVRARDNTRRYGAAGLDGAAVWALTGLSAVLSSLDSRSAPEALFRLAAPVVAAWLWERGMSLERRRTAPRRGVSWRLTPERIAVRLGLADPTDRTADEVAAHRRIARLARAAKRLRELPAGGSERAQRRARRRLDRAMARAVEHAGLAAQPARQEALLAQLGALYHAAALANLDPPPPWAAPHPRSEDSARAESPAPVRRELRTGLNGADRTVGERPPRDQVIAELVAAIRADPGGWRPDYPALMARTGYARRWCEEAVRDARTHAELTRRDPYSNRDGEPEAEAATHG
jgi:hypothetical protein